MAGPGWEGINPLAAGCELWQTLFSWNQASKQPAATPWLCSQTFLLPSASKSAVSPSPRASLLRCGRGWWWQPGDPTARYSLMEDSGYYWPRLFYQMRSLQHSWRTLHTLLETEWEFGGEEEISHMENFKATRYKVLTRGLKFPMVIKKRFSISKCYIKILLHR